MLRVRVYRESFRSVVSMRDLHSLLVAASRYRIISKSFLSLFQLASVFCCLLFFFSPTFSSIQGSQDVSVLGVKDDDGQWKRSSSYACSPCSICRWAVWNHSHDSAWCYFLICCFLHLLIYFPGYGLLSVSISPCSFV